MSNARVYLEEAIAEARKGFEAGGIPIGSVLVDSNGTILGRGHNQWVQHGSTIKHAEMDALESAGRLPAKVYKECTLYTTLAPCVMCTGAILLYKIPSVVVGENKTFPGEAKLLKDRGVTVEVMDNQECKELLDKFISLNPEIWSENNGVYANSLPF